MRTPPDWLTDLVHKVTALTAADVTRFQRDPPGGRPAAVLIAFGEGPEGPDVLLCLRASTMRAHAGQPAFPGGATDPEDGGDPAVTALREACEEVALDAADVSVLGMLPELWLPVSDFMVTPVIAWWHTDSEVRAVDAAEVERVVRVPLADLTDPARRFSIRHPSGFTGPAFDAGGLLIWGFTAGILTALLRAAGLERPWDQKDVRLLPD